ncbi:hypothetical protein L6452_02245 [Arctium lappa]|uniref:Uncharacterized protein n=1 Tax=Arctium lappa TaxID=4217 RepID=A0ACB9FJS7_ARCLA|nr:hypothetical protein L6452_02245 [Arctium lappa]
MDIKWQMAMLTMRVKRLIKRTGRNNFAQKREDGVGFDKSKVECYKCHKLGHFARECRSGMPQQYTSNHQPSQSTSFNNMNSSQALVSQEGMGFVWSDQAEEAVQNQALMAKVSESTSTDIPTEWEKNQLEFKLKKSEEECEKIRSDFEKAKLDIEKFSNASKAMDSLIKSQVHDNLKRGLVYNSTPPPYNNNYIPPTSDLLERQEKIDLPAGATDVDPLDSVVIEEETEEETTKAKHCYFNPINQRITFQRNIQNPVGYRKQIRNHMAENVRRAPITSHAQNKFANSKKNTSNKPRSILKKKKENNFVQVWVPKVKNSVSTVTSNSITDRSSVAASNTTANPISTANDVNTANKVSTANQVSTASSDRPILLTKYSSNETPQFDNLIKSEYEYVDENGKPKTTLAWVPIKN